ncbi:hypothetical protein BC830DRAFT_612030 [Chytriomyces sp. MP71]|nr:hypothetical protein BC830DRAFT_612030 [Chytriomyces sp. MP71]
MEIICEDILHHSCIDSVSDEALAELLFIWKGLNMVDAAVGTEEPSDLDHGFSVLSLTYYLGHTFGANVFRKVAQELDTLVIPAVSKCSHHRVHIPAVRLLYEVCLLQELSLSDMDELSDDLIVSTLLCIDKTSSAECLESYNYSLIKLLVCVWKFHRPVLVFLIGFSLR